ncbi:MAG: hypothetical protein R3C19_22830 [Planctomycetaceae bacterium]
MTQRRSGSVISVVCDGWWEQDGYGRQPMQNLRLQFDGNSVQGQGCDVVGAFTLRGTVDGAVVTLTKQYIGAHAVSYIGTFDGEGTYRGRWAILGFGGDWMIQVKSADGELTEILPA